MKRFTISLLMALLFILTGCSNKTVYKSLWQPSSLSVGDCDDYWFTNMHYSTKAKMHYGLSNDDENLYVSLKVTDETVQRKIMLTGLTFWLDPNGKGKEQLGLNFPVKQPKQKNTTKNRSAAGQQQGDQRKSKADNEKFNSKYKNGLSEIVISGFGGEAEPSLVGNKSKQGINAILRMDSLQVLYYEAQIPLHMIFEKPDEVLGNAAKYFSYAFETGYVETPSTGPAGRSGSAGVKGAGRGGGGGGGRGGGRGGSQASGMDSEKMAAMHEMSQPSKFKVKKAILSSSTE